METQGITRRQLSAVAFVAALTPSTRLLPGYCAAVSGRAAWLCPLAALPGALLIAACVCADMRRRSPGEGLAAVALKLLGRPLGGALLAAYSLWLVFYAAFSLRSASSRFTVAIYPGTAPWPFIAVGAAMSLAAALGKVRALGRSAEIFKALLVLALALSGLSGCSRALLGNYRNIEELQVIQTLGLDGREGGVFVSFSTGRDASGREVVRMGAEGESISGAMQTLQGYSVSGELFFSNTGYILLGEEAARDAGSCLDYIERASEIRLDTPLFVVRGAEAGPLVTAGGGEDGDITEIMSSLERFIERRAAE